MHVKTNIKKHACKSKHVKTGMKKQACKNEDEDHEVMKPQR